MTEIVDPALVGAWIRLIRAQRVVLGKIERAARNAGFPPAAWYDVLLELDRAGDAGLRPFELERGMLLAQYNLSRLLDRIEAAGLIERRACEGDGRGQVAVITPQGRDLRRSMWPAYGTAIRDAVGSHLSATEAAELDRLLSKLLQ